VAKLAVTGAALAVTAYSRALGKKLEQAEGVPVEDGTDPSAATPAEVAQVQKRLDIRQWLIPALTASISVLTSLHGEQQRPGQQLSGIAAKPGRSPGAAGVAAAAAGALRTARSVRSADRDDAAAA